MPAPVLAALCLVAAPILAFLVICHVAGVQFIGAFALGLALAAFAVLWLFEVRRLVEQP